MASPRRRLIFLILLIVFLAFACVALLLSRPQPEITYVRQPNDGKFLADIRLSGKTLQIPGIRLADSRMVLKTFIWKDGAWCEEQLLQKCSFNVERGYRILIRVPDTKSKIQLYHALHRQILLPGRKIGLPIRTNLVLETELRPRREIDLPTP